MDKTPKLFLKACPQCVDAKAMQADRKAHTYTCICCGRTWRDERIVKGVPVVFTGLVDARESERA